MSDINLSDEGNQIIASFLKSCSLKGLRFLCTFLDGTVKRLGKKDGLLYRTNEKLHELNKRLSNKNYSDIKKVLTEIKQVLRKDKSAGITLSDFYEPDKAKYIAKELKRHNQDFSLERRDDGKIRVVTTSNNKELLNVFEDNFEKSKTQQKREPLNKQLFKAAERAKKENSLNKDRNLTVVKHKGIGAR